MGQTIEDRFERLTELEDKIVDDLENIHDVSDDDDDDEKEAQNAFKMYKKCENLSKKSLKKMKKIDKKITKIVLKMKKNLYPDESNWKKWTGKDFKRFVFAKNVAKKEKTVRKI